MLVVGPGTGLGAAVRIPDAGRSVILATEAGQATLAPHTDLELAILAELRKQSARVQVEHVLSGTGLVNLHRAIATLRGVTVPMRSAAEITAAALAKSDPVAVETAAALEEETAIPVGRHAQFEADAECAPARAGAGIERASDQAVFG